EQSASHRTIPRGSAISPKVTELEIVESHKLKGDEPNQRADRRVYRRSRLTMLSGPAQHKFLKTINTYLIL
ncbi:hypothetical protein MTR67_002927, partial [Solanum verrucosum]